MTRHSACLWTLFTLSIVLIGVSVSEAGQCGQWYACNGYYYYYYPACPAVTVSTLPTASISAAGQPMAATPPAASSPAPGQPMASTPAQPPTR